jgi:hypothetical protein
MPHYYYFKFVDTTFIATVDIYELPDEASARAEAEKVAQSFRDTRPDLLGEHYSVSVTRDDGAGVCAVPLDAPE